MQSDLARQVSTDLGVCVMEIGQDAQETGCKIASASIESLSTALRDGVEKFIGHPFKVSSGSVIDSDNKVSDLFAAIVYVETEESQSKAPSQFPADSTAVVIDATDNLTIDKFRAAYLRVAKAKRLKKSPTPLIETPTTNVTTTNNRNFQNASDWFNNLTVIKL